MITLNRFFSPIDSECLQRQLLSMGLAYRQVPKNDSIIALQLYFLSRLLLDPKQIVFTIAKHHVLSNILFFSICSDFRYYFRVYSDQRSRVNTQGYEH